MTVKPWEFFLFFYLHMCKNCCTFAAAKVFMKELPAYTPDFEEYIRQGEPDQKERAQIWRTAIGLQQVDGLETSEYLREVARQHIEGDITLKDVKSLIDSYYKTEDARNSEDAEDKQEADKVSGRIAELLSQKTFTFSPAQLIAIHRHLFQGIYKFAGKIRDYNITKKEWVLRGETVYYASADTIRETLDYDFGREKEFDYSSVSMSDAISHLTLFCRDIWQIHPFGEGNTRTTAVFMIKYLHTLGFDVNNNLFAENSWYFRNALVRANYKNVPQGVDYSPIFLERFFRNLLLGENHPLLNREMHLDWKTPSSTPSSTPASSQNQFETGNENVVRLMRALGHEKLSVKDLMERVGLKDRMNFMEYSLNPAIDTGFVRMLYPEKPKHPRQKYLLTVKGIGWYNEHKA